MKRPDRDPRALGRELAMLAASLGVAALLVLASQHYRDARVTTHEQLVGELQRFRAGLRQAHEDARIVRTEYGRFRQLQERGFPGAAPRLVWVEDIRELARQASVPVLQYQLDPRRPLAHAAAGAAPFQLYASPMTLRMNLDHEGDLVRFLDLLASRDSGPFDLRACTLTRLEGGAAVALDRPNLHAECRLDWYSLDKAPEPDPADEALL